MQKRKPMNVQAMNMALLAGMMLEKAIQGRPLPAMVFFKPTQEFLDFVYYFEGEHRGIVEIGAGNGHLSKILAERGLKVLAIDIIERENSEFPVVLLDATTMSYSPLMLPIVARPCHGEWVELAIRKAFAGGVKNFIYVGLEKNFETDLPDSMGFNRRVYDFKAGQDGEKVVLLTNE